jgi:hypothetical protein
LLAIDIRKSLQKRSVFYSFGPGLGKRPRMPFREDQGEGGLGGREGVWRMGGGISEEPDFSANGKWGNAGARHVRWRCAVVILADERWAFAGCSKCKRSSVETFRESRRKLAPMNRACDADRANK